MPSPEMPEMPETPAGACDAHLHVFDPRFPAEAPHAMQTGATAADYQPLQEAVRLIEEDPDLLRCVLLLLRRHSVPRRELPLPLATDYDPLYLTGIVRRCPDGSYQLHNEIYQRYLERHFSPDRVSRLLTTAGRWEEALAFTASMIASIKAEYGAGALGGITSSRCTNEETYLVQKLVRSVFGTNNVDTCARVCHSPTGYGLGQTFGTSAGGNISGASSWRKRFVRAMRASISWR